MANQRRDEPIPVKSGTAGPPRKVAETEATGAKPSRSELDARQERMRSRRRKGPELPPGEERPEAAAAQPPVPPTECDDEGDE